MKKMLMHVLLVLMLCSLVLVLPAAAVTNGKIAFDSRRDGNWEIYVMNPDGTDQTRLTNNPLVDGGPSWSPDGSKIAFYSARDGNYEIYVMNADGTGQTRLTNNPLFDGNPSWSPDGSKIAFISYLDGNWEIYAMKTDGTDVTRLTNNPAEDHNPSWSPDGSKIAFNSDRDGNFEIYVMNADGSGQTRLTTNLAEDVSPAWSPDGTLIAFRSNYQICTMNSADGSDQTQLTINGGAEPAWAPATTPGSLEVKSSPSKAKIYINGIYKEQVTKWTFDDMAPGDYNVSVMLEGYATPATETVKVISGQTASLHFKLDKVKKVK